MCVRRVSACVIGEFACFTKATRFGGPHALGRRGRCQPVAVLASRASGIAVATLAACAAARAASQRSREAGDRFHRRRVTAGGDTDPRCLPSIGSLCPAALSRAPGSGLVSTGGIAAPASRRHRLASIESCDRSRPVPVHASRCRRDRASLDLGCRPTTSATWSTRGHTLRALDSSHASGALASPAARRDPRGPGCVGFHGALPHREPASHDLRATACARCAPLAWTGQIVSRTIRGRLALLDERCACPSRMFRAPESPARTAASPGASRVGTRRPRLARDVASRKETSPKRSLGAFHRAETRTRTLVRARTGISSRRLRRGIARRCSRLSCSHRRACF